MSDLTTLPNIGKELSRKLTAVGIPTAEALRSTGAKTAYVQLKAAYPNVCTVHLYALEGAVQEVPFHCLPKETTQALKRFSDSLRDD